jgi:N utilization substance protein B
MISRRKAREYAMQTLYAAEVGGDQSRVSTEDGENALMHEEPVAAETRAYGLALSSAARRRAEEIDQLIAEASDRWEVSRLAVVDRVILRMSIAELLTQPDVPARVCINEAVEIARKFSTEHSSRFVNGVLDAVSRRLQASPDPDKN